MSYLDKHPETGEEGRWQYIGGMGWMNQDAWQGPRTHYEDGSPVDSWTKYRKDWNPDWSTRVNDIFSFVGQGGGAGRTTARDDYNYATFDDPYWRTIEGRQWIQDAAISGRSLEEINREMAQMSERAQRTRDFWAGDNPLTSGSRGGTWSGMMGPIGSARSDAVDDDALGPNWRVKFLTGLTRGDSKYQDMVEGYDRRESEYFTTPEFKQFLSDANFMWGTSRDDLHKELNRRADRYEARQSGGMMMQAPRTSDVSMPAPRSGGFLEAYNKRREEIASRPSVMSLLQDMKDFK